MVIYVHDAMALELFSVIVVTYNVANANMYQYLTRSLLITQTRVFGFWMTAFFFSVIFFFSRFFSFNSAAIRKCLCLTRLYYRELILFFFLQTIDTNFWCSKYNTYFFLYGK